MKYYIVRLGTTLSMDGTVRNLFPMLLTKEEILTYKEIGLLDTNLDIDSLSIHDNGLDE